MGCFCYEGPIPAPIPSEGQYAFGWTAPLHNVFMALAARSQNSRLTPLSIIQVEQVLAGQSGFLPAKTREVYLPLAPPFARRGGGPSAACAAWETVRSGFHVRKHRARKGWLAV